MWDLNEAHRRHNGREAVRLTLLLLRSGHNRRRNAGSGGRATHAVGDTHHQIGDWTRRHGARRLGSN
jgi:hypothetical protein